VNTTIIAIKYSASYMRSKKKIEHVTGRSATKGKTEAKKSDAA
jgi:hypothetical protein